MTDDKIQEIQILEQNLQNLLMQKQAFQMEQAETKAALKELENSGDETYKIIGQLMLRTEKQKIKKELQEKEKIIGLRIKTMEKQESTFSEKIENLRGELMKEEKK